MTGGKKTNLSLDDHKGSKDTMSCQMTNLSFDHKAR